MTRSLNLPRGGFPNMRPMAPQEPAKKAPSGIAAAVPGLAPALRLIKQEHVGTKPLLIFTNQLATMLAAGCDLCLGLDSLARQQPHPYMKKVVQSLSNSVQAGRSFSQALAEHPHVFSPLYVAMVRAGETSGTLRAMLQSLQSMLRRQARIVSSVRGALLYPAILTMVAVAAVIVMITFVLPRFAQVFRSSGTALPTITVITIQVSEFAAHNFVWLLGGFLSVVLILFWVLRLPSVRPHAHAWALNIPLVGQALRLSYVVRSIQTFGALISSGLPVADALQLVRDLIPNIHFQRFFNKLNEHITEGKPIAPDFEKTTLFPPMVGQMIAVGEQTGTLPTVCTEISSLYEEELSDRIKLLTTALEPIIIVVLGGFVALIAVSVILPMFKLSSTVK